MVGWRGGGAEALYHSEHRLSRAHKEGPRRGRRSSRVRATFAAPARTTSTSQHIAAHRAEPRLRGTQRHSGPGEAHGRHHAAGGGRKPNQGRNAFCTMGNACKNQQKRDLKKSSEKMLVLSEQHFYVPLTF